MTSWNILLCVVVVTCQCLIPCDQEDEAEGLKFRGDYKVSESGMVEAVMSQCPVAHLNIHSCLDYTSEVLSS